MIKVFSHNDLDGYGCNLIIKAAFPSDEVSVTNVNNSNADKTIKKFFDTGEYFDYDTVYITDVRVSEGVAKLIDRVIVNSDLQVRLIDHHVDAIRLNEHCWAKVQIEKQGEATCATSLVYRELEYKLEKAYETGSIDKQSLLELVETIRRYDTWLWETKYNDMRAKQLNDLYNILGTERFIPLLDKIAKVGEFNLDCLLSEYKLILDLEQEKIDRYVSRKNSDITPYLIKGYKAGVVFADQYISELGNRLATLNPEFDLIIMIAGSNVSYRSRKPGVDCSKIAKAFQGGGHALASASAITNGCRLNMIDACLCNNNRDKKNQQQVNR